MNTHLDSLNSTSAREEQLSFSLEGLEKGSEKLVLASIDKERVLSRKRLETMHPGNRFRLLAGLRPLAEEPTSSKSR